MDVDSRAQRFHDRATVNCQPRIQAGTVLRQIIGQERAKRSPSIDKGSRIAAKIGDQFVRSSADRESKWTLGDRGAAVDAIDPNGQVGQNDRALDRDQRR